MECSKKLPPAGISTNILCHRIQENAIQYVPIRKLTDGSNWMIEVFFLNFESSILNICIMRIQQRDESKE